MSRTTCLAALICVNLVLLAALMLAATSARTASAQSAPTGDPYLLVTGEILDDFDALYVLDMRERTLHTFYFRKGTRELQYAGYRNLEQDLRHREPKP
jgi:hypothetical protein